MYVSPYSRSKMTEMQSEEELQWVCPSFNSYSSNKLADIAARVSDEVNGGVKFNDESLTRIVESEEDDNDEEEEEFEFALVTDEIYYDGKIRPIFPIFNRDLLLKCEEPSNAIKIPLKQLFSEDRESRELLSSSSEEDGEVESASARTYCVWKTKKVEKSPSSCKKSKSTGSASIRWRIRDFLRRSNSEGKDSFVILTPKKKEEKSDKKKSKAKIVTDCEKSLFLSSSSSPIHDAFFNWNKGKETPRRTPLKGNETPRRKTYLPYKRDLVGFFATVNTISSGRTFPPF